MSIVRVWLLGPEGDLNDRTVNAGSKSCKAPQSKLLYAKLTQELLEPFKERILANPDRMLDIVEQILTLYTEKLRSTESTKNQAQQLSIASLGSLVKPVDGNSVGQDEKGLQWIVSMPLGLFGVLLSARSDNIRPTGRTALESLQRIIAALIESQGIPKSLAFSASTIRYQISELQSDSSSRQGISQTPSPYATALTIRSITMNNLSSPMPPIPAEGLTSLISSSSLVIDVPSTTILHLSLLEDDDEYTYLVAMKSLDILAQQHPRTVIGLILGRYVDQEEETALDVRLRMGDALRSVLAVLGPSLKAETGAFLAESLMFVAGRRGYKPKAADEQRKRKPGIERERTKTEKGSGGEFSTLKGDEDADNGCLLNLHKSFQTRKVKRKRKMYACEHLRSPS